MANKPALNENMKKEVERLVSEGVNVTQVAKRIGVSRVVINKFCEKNGLAPVRGTSPENVEKVRKYISALKRTGSPKKAAEESGIRSNGRHIINKHNLQSYIRNRSHNKLSLEEATSRIPGDDEAVGFEGGKYIVRAPDGFEYRKSAQKLHQGDPRGKSGRVQTEASVATRLKRMGYTYVQGTFKDTHSSFEAVCDECGNVRRTRIELFNKQGCPACSNTGTSVAEAEISEWVRSLGLDAEKHRFPGKTRGKEIDVYVPSLRLGIEYCGLYWHSEGQGKGRNYHRDKALLANENGIRLVTIFEDEWRDRKEQVKGYLLSKVGANSRRVYARKCEVLPICKKESRNFLERYHIQGAARSDGAFGIFLGEELLGVVTGGRHHRKQGVYTLNRLAFKCGVTVVGGASRLFKALASHARGSGYHRMVSWSDNRWGEGSG